MSIITDYWDQQWVKAVETPELEAYSQSIPNDFRKEIVKHPILFSVIINAKTITDVGFGTGHMLYTLSKFNDAICVGYEISNTACIYAFDKYYDESNHRFHFYCEDVINGEFTHHINSDLIVCSNVLEHFKEPYPAIDKLLKHCRFMLILVPNEGTANDGYVGEGGAGHVTLFNKNSFYNYEVLDLFTFYSHGWTEGENPLQLVALLKGRI